MQIKNHNEIVLHTSTSYLLEWLLSKRQVSVGKDVQKGEPLWPVGRNVILYITPLKTVWKFLKLLNTELQYDPAILLLDIYIFKGNEITTTNRYLHLMSIVALCTKIKI